MQLKPVAVSAVHLSASATARHGNSLVTTGEYHRSAELKALYFDSHNDEKATLARLLTTYALMLTIAIICPSNSKQVAARGIERLFNC